MKRLVWNAMAVTFTVVAVALAYVSLEIERQSTIDEAQPADIVLVLGAAEYRGKPSPVFKARLDHAFDLYSRKLAPRIMTMGGAGGDPVFTEGEVGRSYLIGRGVSSEAIVVENESESTVESLAMASEIMRRMSLQSAIVVSDGYHIYRVKKMLQFRGLRVYGSPRKETRPDPLHERWNYLKQAIGYLLWNAGLGV
jgi:uncharacterized SAM-binding protein YcdF (DUF218 family)